MENKRGLSTIVVTLIIVLLSIVAIGIVWAVVKGILTSSSQGLELNSKCLNIQIEATQMNCSDGATTKICDIKFTRTGSESSPIAGVKLVFRNETSETSSNLIEVTGNIEQLVGKKQTGIDTGIANENGLNKVEVTAFFKDASGNEQLCSQTSSFKI